MFKYIMAYMEQYNINKNGLKAAMQLNHAAV